MRRVWLVVLIISVLVGCTGGEEEPQSGPIIATATTRNYPTAAPPQLTPSPTPTATFSSSSGGVVLNPNCPAPTGWQAYIVAQGDTLGLIADAIGSSMDILQQYNCLDSPELIFAGQILYLPSLPAGVQPYDPGVLVVPTSIPTSATCIPPAGWFQYVIVAGDTLGTIAEAVNSTVGVLQNANCLASTGIIYIGQTLYVPRLPSGVLQAATATATVEVSLTCTTPAGWQAYSVTLGDTLGTIATRFGTTVSTLQQGNCITDPNTIFVGQVIYVPSTGGVILPTATPTLTATVGSAGGSPPLIAQTLVVRPTMPRQDGALVTLQETITLDVGTVADADRVMYMARLTPTDPDPVMVGVDNDPYDGTRVEYTFSEFTPDQYFFAVAENEFGTYSSPLTHVVYDPTFAMGSGRPDIFPFLGFDGSIYTLQPGETVTLSWADAPTTAARVEFHLVQSSGDRIVATDTTPADGARAQWQVIPLIRGQLFARAVYSTGASVDSGAVNVYSEEN